MKSDGSLVTNIRGLAKKLRELGASGPAPSSPLPGFDSACVFSIYTSYLGFRYNR